MGNDEHGAARPNGTPDRTQLAGRYIAGKYYLEYYIGSGSTGAVYRARHSVLEKPVALKILDPELAGSPGMVELFKHEAKAASRLDHPNSVRILDFGADVSGLLYIAMEFVQGPDLLHLLDDEFPLSEERIVAIMSQLLGAVAQAHELGVVHRDLKPENIVILSGTTDDGQPTDIAKVCDFGVAQLSPLALPARPLPRRAPLHPTVVDTNVLVGTPEYMSPEQARGEALDALSDVYAAGIVLFQLLTNRLPFAAADVGDIAMLQCYAPAPRPSELAKVSAPLEAICLKAMAKDPAQRYQSAREMRAALRQVAFIEHAQTLRPLAVSSPPPPAAEDTPRRPAGVRRRALPLALAMIALGPAAAAAYMWPSGSLHEVIRRVSLRGKTSITDALHAPQAARSSVQPARGTEASPEFDQLARAVVRTDAPEFAVSEEVGRSTSGEGRVGLSSARRRESIAYAGPADTQLQPSTLASANMRTSTAANTGAPLESPSAATPEESTDAVLRVIPQPELGEPEMAAALPSPASSAAPPAPALQDSTPPRASMRITDVIVRGPLATSVVERAIARVQPGLAACYWQSARAAGRNGYGAIRVEVELNERGRVRASGAEGEVLPGLSRCLSEVASKLVTRQAPDTGTARASWKVTFER